MTKQTYKKTPANRRMIAIVDEYRRRFNKTQWTTEEVADWALSKGLYPVPGMRDPIEAHASFDILWEAVKAAPEDTTVMVNPPLDSVFCQECGQCPCCCGVRKNHAEDCKFRKAVECSVAIECDHGHDVCSECDPCTCGVGLKEDDLR